MKLTGRGVQISSSWMRLNNLVVSRENGMTRLLFHVQIVGSVMPKEKQALCY